MENGKRLIDANELEARLVCEAEFRKGIMNCFGALVIEEIIENELANSPTVDAVEVPDKKLLKAINLLIKQYEHSQQSDYVHNPIAHAFFHTWKQLDESGYGERRST